MGELEVPERELEYFATSARAGRRNALPEIEVEINDQDAAKLAERMSDMTAHCEETAENQNQPGHQNLFLTRMTHFRELREL